MNHYNQIIVYLSEGLIQKLSEPWIFPSTLLSCLNTHTLREEKEDRE